MGLVFRADGLHAVGVGEVVVAIGEFGAALEKIGGIVVGVVEAGSDPEAEDVRGVEVGGVEGVDIGAEGEAESVGEFLWGVDGLDESQVWLESGHAVGFYGGFVHVGVVEVGDFALVGACGCVGLCSIVDDAGDLFEASVDEGVEDPDCCAVGRELGPGDVAAVGVEVEFVAGVDSGVHVGDGDAGVSARMRGLRECRG